VTSLQVLDGQKVNLDALRKRLAFLEDAIVRAPSELQDVLLCNPNAEMLHAVLLGFSAETSIYYKMPDELAAHVNRTAVAHVGSDAASMFAVHHEDANHAYLYDWEQVYSAIRLRPEAFNTVPELVKAVLLRTPVDLGSLFPPNPDRDQWAWLSGYPVVSMRKYREKTDYTGYSPVRDFMWSLYLRRMDRPENKELDAALDDYEENGFHQMVREPAEFEKRRKLLETQLKAAFDPAVGTIDAILDNKEEAEGYVEESHEVGRVSSELYGQPTHARYLFEKIIVYAKLDWLNPPNNLFRYSHYRLDHEGTVQMARMDDALHEAGYFKRMELLKKEHCR